jgi:hypothetical protein
VLTAGQALPLHHAAFQQVIVSCAAPVRYVALLVAAIVVARGQAGRRVLALTAPVAVLAGLEELAGWMHAGPYRSFYFGTGWAQTNGLINSLYIGFAVIVAMLAVAAWRGSRVTRPFATAV